MGAEASVRRCHQSHRLVYEVRDERLVVVVAVGKRERQAVYRAAEKR
ncbi:MAG: type II toxin-antitoxin system RelE/ParE family toxin [Hyphomicrobiales bacterium]